MLTCDECRKYLDAYVYGESSFYLNAQIEEHLASCPACREEAAFLQQIRDTLSQMPKIEVDDSFKAALNQRIDQLEAKAPPAKKWKFYKDWRMISALAACVLLAVVIQSNVFELGQQVEQNGVAPEIQEISDLDLTQITPTDAPADGTAAVPEADANAAVDAGEAPAAQTAQPRQTTVPQTGGQASATPEARDTDAVNDTEAPTVTQSATVAQPTAAPQPEANTAQPAEDAAPSVAAVRDAAPMQTEEASIPKVSGAPAGNNLRSSEEDEAAEAAYGSGARGGSGGGGSGGTAVYSAPAASTGSGVLYVDSEDVSKAQDIADRYGTRSGSNVEMPKAQLNDYLNELQENGVEYSANISGGDTVNFDIAGN